MRFQIFKKRKDGKYYFKLKAKNGWPLLSSFAHDSIKDIKETIKGVQGRATDDEQYERKIAKNGRHYYEIIDEEKAAMAVSRFYSSRVTMNAAIRRVKVIATKAVIVEKQSVLKGGRVRKKRAEEV